MRVLADGSPLTDSRRQAGIGRYVRQLADALAGLPDLTFQLATPPVSPSDRTWLRWVNAQPWIVGRAATWRADIIHAMATDPVIGWPLRRQVVTVHDALMWTTHAPKRPRSITGRYLAFQRRRFRDCAAVVAVSETAAVEATEVLGVSPERIHVVPEGVDEIFRVPPDPSDIGRRRRAGVDEQRYVLWVGDLRHHDPRKGLDDLLEAIKAIGHNPPHLVLAGSAGDESRRLARAAAARDVRLTLPGYVDDASLAALYRGAAVVAIPSRHEGFGLTLLEALACGAPVVAARGGNLTSLAGDAALFVRPGDVAGLSQAISAVLSDDRLRARLAAVGPTRSALFTWRRAAELTAQVYRTAFATSKGG